MKVFQYNTEGKYVGVGLGCGYVHIYIHLEEILLHGKIT